MANEGKIIITDDAGKRTVIEDPDISIVNVEEPALAPAAHQIVEK